MNSSARILGLDVGRKYTGVSISNRQLTDCKPLKTLVADAQYESSSLDLNKLNGLYGELRKIIFNKNIKGIIIGYPLDHDG